MTKAELIANPAKADILSGPWQSAVGNALASGKAGAIWEGE